MKFEDKRAIKNVDINVGDLIIGTQTNYIIIQDIGDDKNEYKYHLVNLKSCEVEDSFNNLKDTYDIVTDCEEILDIIPFDRLRIVAE